MCLWVNTCYSTHIAVIGQLTGVGSCTVWVLEGWWSTVTCSAISLRPPFFKKKKKKNQKNRSNIRNSFHPYTLPYFSERSWQDAPLLCAASHGSPGVGPSRKRQGKGGGWEVLKATADSTLVCYLLYTVSWDCRCSLHIWLYMWVDLNGCTCVVSEQ